MQDLRIDGQSQAVSQEMSGRESQEAIRLYGPGMLT